MLVLLTAVKNVSVEILHNERSNSALHYHFGKLPAQSHNNVGIQGIFVRGFQLISV